MQRDVLFYDPRFPYPGQRPTPSQIATCNEVFIVADAQSVGDVIKSNPTACLVFLHGSYFPKHAWSEILQHVRSGGGLVCIGSAPFQHPVRIVNGQWIEESVQTAYHRQLHIHDALVVEVDSVCSLEHNAEIPLFSGREHLFTIEPAVGLVIQGTHQNDHPEEHGSSGPMEAHIYPLLRGVSADNRSIAAPAVLIEHTKSDFAGGRWLFVTQTVGEPFWTQGGVEALREWAEFCARGTTEIWVRPDYACYNLGDQPTLIIQTQRIRPTERSARDLRIGNTSEWTLLFDVYFLGAGRRENVWSTQIRVHPSEHWESYSLTIPISIASGLYQIECTGKSESGERRVWVQGFWGNDPDLLSSGDRLRCERDYFWKDGKPFPVVGMTYMASDVARKFLFLPNPAVWDRDMKQMKRAGINLIRTGIWTGWRNTMLVDGHPSESVMRAIDAFVLTAKRHHLEVTFTFFAFAPETWEGGNPYLDTRSIEAQRRFVAAIVSRHRHTKNLQWDLINEPSVFDPKRVFQGPRTTQDLDEREAWVTWLANRHTDIVSLQERWDMTPEELPDFISARLPEREDINFGITDMSAAKRGNLWIDYCLFTMDMFNHWVCGISETIRFYAPDTLITVGQDEGMTSQRPSPFFYADTVDYTTVHSWWQMDHLVWDGVFSKALDKPNLVQETGIMYVENTDGKPKRTEKELRNILERKYAYAFATGSAGAVHWVWDTNLYMNDVNEINIGARRVDGTEKPEADVSYDFGRFMSGIERLFVNRKLEDIVVVYPYSNDFSNRQLAFDATTHLTRTLFYDMKVPFRALGEYHLRDSLCKSPPKLIIVPSAHHFSRGARTVLFDYIRNHGGILLWTGPLHRDEYWDEIPPYDPRLQPVTIGNVQREEKVDVGGRELGVSFPGSRIAQVSKEFVHGSIGPSVDDGVVPVYEIPLGQGTMLWCPLPVELGNSKDALVELYSMAITRSGVSPELEWKLGKNPGVFGRKLEFETGALFTFVSESGYDNDVVVNDPVTQKTYSFKLHRDRSVLFAVDVRGEITHVYRSAEVEIEVS